MSPQQTHPANLPRILSTRSKYLNPKAETLPIDRSGPRIVNTEEAIRHTARQRSGNIFFILLRRAFSDLMVTLQDKSFRNRPNDQACQAYCAMDMDQFDGINALQNWANWRTLPENLNQRLPSAPVRIIDLCCGTGQSTEVLAHYAAPGSRILGLEYNPRFLERARSRDYPGENGDPANVSFNAQSVLETFRDETQQRLPESSVDLINSCGAVGCHFDPPATQILALEITRVLKTGGLATIDSGKAGTSTGHLEEIFKALGFSVLHRAKSCAADRCTQVCFQKK